jgi:hypothetical protein
MIKRQSSNRTNYNIPKAGIYQGGNGMKITALVTGILSGAAAILGILRAIDIPDTPLLNNNFTMEFWFWISALLLLGTIAMLQVRKNDIE